MLKILEYCLFGFSTGFISGISPGPLLALAISETLKGNIRNGIFVALSPIFSDIPVLLLSIWLLNKIEGFGSILSYISVAGGLILIYLGLQNLKVKPKHISVQTDIKHSFLKAILINFLSPYTYLFWFFIGASILRKAEFSLGLAFILSYFLGIFYSMLIIVFFTEKVKTFFESRLYTLIIKAIGFIFIGFGLFLVRNGIQDF